MIRRLVFALLVTALPLLALMAVAATEAAPPAGAAGSTPAYWLAASDGGIFSFGGATYYGSTGGMVLNKPVVGMAATSDGGGYYEVASDGGVFSYGDATFYGSTGSIRLNQPIVGMAVVPGGGGYWLVAADGGIFSFGSATFYGSTGSIRLNKPVVGMAATPSGHGYWLVASDGGIFSYGDASFYGSTGSIRLNKPIVSMITGPSGAGYFLVASDGGIFSFGTAPFFGSLGGQSLKHPIVAAAATPTGNGYWFTDTAGLVSNFGQANYYGSAPANLFRPIVAMAEAPGNGAFVGSTYPSGFLRLRHQQIPMWDASTGTAPDRHRPGRREFVRQHQPVPRHGVVVGGRRTQPVHLPDVRDVGCQRTGLQRGHVVQCRVSGRDFRVQRCRRSQRRIHVDPVVDRRGDRQCQLVRQPGRERPVRPGHTQRAARDRGIPYVGIYASPGVWNGIVGNYQPDVPYWMADYLSSPSGPGSCADITNWWQGQGAKLPTGPLEIVQYNSTQFDDDYAC